MSSRRRKPKHTYSRRNDKRRLTIRSVRRDPPDFRKISKAVIGLAMAEAEREAQAQRAGRNAKADATSQQAQAGGQQDE